MFDILTAADGIRCQLALKGAPDKIIAGVVDSSMLSQTDIVIVSQGDQGPIYLDAAEVFSVRALDGSALA